MTARTEPLREGCSTRSAAGCDADYRCGAGRPAQAEAARTATAARSTTPAGTGGLGRVEELREVDEAPLGSPRHPAAPYPFRRVGAGPQGAVNTRPASRSAASLRLATAGSLSVFDQSQPRV